MSLNSQGFIGNVKVFTTENRGFTPEEIAERALDKIIYVGDRSHPVILEQARAFKESLRTVLIHYLDEAQQSERVTISAKLRAAGHPQIADIIGEL
jgi:HD superfamily phosphohydrolase YqeK